MNIRQRCEKLISNVETFDLRSTFSMCYTDAFIVFNSPVSTISFPRTKQFPQKIGELHPLTQNHNEMT